MDIKPIRSQRDYRAALKTAGAHDALIAATAIHHGHALLIRNNADFRIFPGLKVEAFADSE